MEIGDTKAADCWFNHEIIGLGPGGINGVTLKERKSVPDNDPVAWNAGPFYRVELKEAWDILPNVRPWVLYVNAGKSSFFWSPRYQGGKGKTDGNWHRIQRWNEAKSCPASHC